MLVNNDLNLSEKLHILSDSAKYDVSCASSGVERSNNGKGIGNTKACGICHTFSADGRCVSLLKILFSNECIFDCKYCINRSSNDILRTSFTPEEVCRLTIEFYRRNYIEGLFLSSGIVKSPDETMQNLLETVFLLRTKYHFGGYIHVKGIPGASDELIELTGWYADRMSINLELPTAKGLKMLAPHKSRASILKPMKKIQNGITEQLMLPDFKDNTSLLRKYGSFRPDTTGRNSHRFVPAGQSTQMIVGATDETDFHMITVAEALYKQYSLKRVYYSAFINVNNDESLPMQVDADSVPLLREHRLYQADWLMRYYNFKADELLSEDKPDFNRLIDPKCDWALRHLEQFPVEVMRADYYTLLRVPGIGVKSAKRIIAARRQGTLDFQILKKAGVVLKRALYFITCNGHTMYNIQFNEDYITRNLIGEETIRRYQIEHTNVYRQLSLFDNDFLGASSMQVLE